MTEARHKVHILYDPICVKYLQQINSQTQKIDSWWGEREIGCNCFGVVKWKQKKWLQNIMNVLHATEMYIFNVCCAILTLIELEDEDIRSEISPSIHSEEHMLGHPLGQGGFLCGCCPSPHCDLHIVATSKLPGVSGAVIP